MLPHVDGETDDEISSAFCDAGSSSFLIAGSVDPKRSSFSTVLTPNPRQQCSDVLSTLTVNKLNFADLGLSGRDQEVSVLKGCLDELSSGVNARQVVLISGYSGTGKTTLADILKEPTRKLKGIYVQGKFDLTTRNDPYVGIISASTQMCTHILSFKGEPVFEEVCQRIKDGLGTELLLLVRFIPAVSGLVGVDDQGAEFSNGSLLTLEEAKNQFMFAFQRFVRIVSDAFAPLIFALDDLQWADGASLHLIDAIASDQKVSKIMFLGIYRSNEVSQTHIFHRYLDGFRTKDKENTFRMTEIMIGNLDFDSVHKIIGELLSAEANKRAVQLAEVCYEKTQGNALFLLHFLSMLNTRNLLRYNLGLAEWTWDIDEIKEKTYVSENVVDLLKSKIMDLPANMIVILKVAACLGSTFQEHTLKIVVEDISRELLLDEYSEEKVELGLSKLEQDGYFKEMAQSSSSLPTSSRTFFTWTHDKILEAAASLGTNQKEWVAFGHRVGTILSTKLNPSELDSSIFVVVGLLNQLIVSGACQQQMDQEEQLKIAALNYQASQKAVSLSAFESAAVYAAFGIKLLPQDRWKNHYKLSLGLYSLGAQSEGYLDNHDTMKQYCNEVLSLLNVSLEDKFLVYHTLIDNNRNRGKPDEAADQILEILKQYGCHFPKNPVAVILSIVKNLIPIKANAKSQDVEGLNMMDDPMRFEMLKLIDKLFICWYMTHDIRLPLATFRILSWTKKYGYSDYSSVAYATTGMILAGVLGDMPGGVAYAKQALKLMEKSPTTLTHARTLFAVHAFVSQSTTPFVQLQKPLLLAYDVGLRCGDAETSTYAIHFWLLDRFISGNSLQPLELDFELYSKQMKDLGRQPQYHFTSYMRQVLLNLMGRNDGDLLELVGDAYCEEELSFCKQDGFLSPGLSSYQGILLTYFGDHLRHADNAIRCGHDYLQKVYPCNPIIPYDHCMKGVSCFVAASVTKKRKYVKMAEKLRSKLKHWRESGNPNVKQFESLLDAESDRFHDKKKDAVRNYEATILFSSRAGYQHTAAYACERLGDFYLEVMDDKDEASYRIQQAIRCWGDYGASAKVRDLQTKYGNILHRT